MYFYRKKFIGVLLLVLFALGNYGDCIAMNARKSVVTGGKVHSTMTNETRLHNSKNTTEIEVTQIDDTYNGSTLQIIYEYALSFQNSLSSFFLPLTRLYSILSTPDESKVEKGNMYSEVLHLKIIPCVKVSLYILVLITLLAIICLSSFRFSSWFCAKDQVKKNDDNSSKQEGITLKGRKKRNPITINYNELFIGDAKKKEKKQGNEEGNSSNPHNNLDEFFERVREKEEYQKTFANMCVLSPEPIKLKEEKAELNQNHFDLIVFDNDEKNTKIKENEKEKEKSLFENRISHQSQGNATMSILSPIIEKQEGKDSKEKEKPKIENEQEIIQEKNEEDDNEENRRSKSIEEKMKNPELFQQTALSHIPRKSTHGSFKK